MTTEGVVVEQITPNQLSKEQLSKEQLKTARQARYSPGQSAHKFSQYLYPLLALALLLLVNVLLDPQFFSLQWQDGRLYGPLIDILNRSAPVALLAIGMSLVIATGGIDLSVGAVMAICGAVCANLLLLGDWSIPAVIAIALLTGLACGLINGVMVSYLGIQPIVATLVLMVAGRGVAQLLNQGQIVTFQNPDFAALGSGSFLGLPVPVWLVLLALLVMQLLLRRTALGLFIEAVGCNAKASRYLGIDDRGIKLTVYLLTGGCAALAGIIATADIQGSDANNAGLWLELDAILAVVIGGAALTGGRFSLPRAVIGVLIIQALSTTIVVSGLPSKFNLLIKALVILLVLMLQSELFRNQLKALLSFGKARGGKA